VKPEVYFDVFVTYANGAEVSIATYRDQAEAQRIASSWMVTYDHNLTEVRVRIRRYTTKG
jgi:hypothetical protein